MSTRSFICRTNADQSITSLYCHFDGYPEHHWPILTEHYNTNEKVDQLLALGDLSVLGQTIGEKVDFDTYRAYDHSPTQCVAFTRDRGESCPADIHHSMLTLIGQYNNAWGEHIYVWANNEWHHCQEPTVKWLRSLFKEPQLKVHYDEKRHLQSKLLIKGNS